MSDGTFGAIYSVGVVADSADGIDALGGVAAVDAESIVADAADGIGSVGGAADIADGILPNDDEVVDVPIEEQDVLQTLSHIEGLGINGVRFSKVQFSWAVDDFVAFVFVND